MTITVEKSDAQIQIDNLPSGKKRICVQPLDQAMFIARKQCDTSYSVELVQLILNVKGASYLCDEIARDEDPLYVEKGLRNSILAYDYESSFVNKRILDFGCGSGSSTMILARMFPQTQIIGVELCREFLEIAEFRLQHYVFDNVKFFLSPSSLQLPKEIGYFDFVILNAVYEHLLPNERELILPKLWSILMPGGILFINETPHRYFPIEGHTTSLPLINYFPDNMSLAVARRFSKRVGNNETWETLLRKGIRGATEGEIINIIHKECSELPIVLEPNRLGLNDRIDLWHASLSQRLPTIKRLLKFLLKKIKLVFGVTFVSSLSLALKKSDGSGKLNVDRKS